jgi:hypothetical protein
MGVSGQQHAPAVLYPQERPSTHSTGGWVGPRSGLDGGKSCPTGIRSPDCPARSQLLYRLNYWPTIHLAKGWEMLEQLSDYYVSQEIMCYM